MTSALGPSAAGARSAFDLVAAQPSRAAASCRGERRDEGSDTHRSIEHYFDCVSMLLLVRHLVSSSFLLLVVRHLLLLVRHLVTSSFLLLVVRHLLLLARHLVTSSFLLLVVRHLLLLVRHLVTSSFF